MSNLYNDPDDFDLDEDDFEEEFEEAYTGSYGRPKKQKKDELGDLMRLHAQERKSAGEPPEKSVDRYLARNKPATRRSGQEHDDMQVTRESIQGMIETILSGNLVESTQSFTDIITAKIAARLEESKISVAQRVFGIQESHDDDDDDNDHDDYSKTISKMKKPKENDDYKDEKHAEVDDDSFSKSLHGKLKTAEDIDDNPLSDDEKENPNDKRVQAGLAARAAKGEMSKPNAHRDIDLRQGSVTLQHGDAKRINNFMAGLKPQKRQEVMAHMQKSPKHFDAVHDVIKKFPAPKQNTSIYGEDFQAEALDMSSLKAIGGKSRGSVEDQKAKRAATVKPSTSPSVTGAGDKQSYYNPKNAPKQNESLGNYFFESTVVGKPTYDGDTLTTHHTHEGNHFTAHTEIDDGGDLHHKIADSTGKMIHAHHSFRDWDTGRISQQPAHGKSQIFDNELHKKIFDDHKKATKTPLKKILNND